MQLGDEKDLFKDLFSKERREQIVGLPATDTGHAEASVKLDPAAHYC